MILHESDTLDRIDRTLRDAGVTESTLASVIMTFKNVLEEKERLENRLNWLETAIDEADLEEIYVRYQKEMKLDHWSGDPS